MSVHAVVDTVTVLVNELAAAPDQVALVLDDYHLIDAPEVHRSLEFLLDHLPASLHLVLASRSDPPLPLARLRARGPGCNWRRCRCRDAPTSPGSSRSSPAATGSCWTT